MMLGLSDLLIQYLIRGLAITIPVHEYGHLLALRLLGFYGEIRSTGLNLTYPTFGRPIAPWEHITVYGAGGFIQAIVFTALSMRDQDPENRLVDRMIALEGIVYGAFEALAPYTLWGFGAFAGAMAAAFLFIYVLMKKKPDIVLRLSARARMWGKSF